jgi:hypothetical protein
MGVGGVPRLGEAELARGAVEQARAQACSRRVTCLLAAEREIPSLRAVSEKLRSSTTLAKTSMSNGLCTARSRDLVEFGNKHIQV